MATTLEQLAAILNEIKQRAAYICTASDTTTGRIIALADDGLRVIGAAASLPAAASATESPAPQSSVQIEGRAKGPPAVTTKSYCPSIDAAAAEAMRVYDMVTARYAAPKAEGEE